MTNRLFFATVIATVTGLTGCDNSTIKVGSMLPFGETAVSDGKSWHAKNGWVAEKYFDDPKVIELCLAIEANDLNAMQKAIDNGANVKALGKDKMTPLLWALNAKQRATS
jgi:hypothetical protein